MNGTNIIQNSDEYFPVSVKLILNKFEVRNIPQTDCFRKYPSLHTHRLLIQYEFGSGHTELDPHVCCPPSVGTAAITSYKKEVLVSLKVLFLSQQLSNQFHSPALPLNFLAQWEIILPLGIWLLVNLNASK